MGRWTNKVEEGCRIDAGNRGEGQRTHTSASHLRIRCHLCVRICNMNQVHWATKRKRSHLCNTSMNALANFALGVRDRDASIRLDVDQGPTREPTDAVPALASTPSSFDNSLTPCVQSQQPTQNGTEKRNRTVSSCRQGRT